MNDIYHNYIDLVGAVIRLAVEDYNIVLKFGDHKQYYRAELEYFFKSRWFGQLCDIDPEYFLAMVQNQVDPNPHRERKSPTLLLNGRRPQRK